MRHMYPRHHSMWKRLSARCYFKASISRSQTIAETQNCVSIAKENPSIGYSQGTSTLRSFPQQWGQIDCIELNTCGDLFSPMTNKCTVADYLAKVLNMKLMAREDFLCIKKNDLAGDLIPPQTELMRLKPKHISAKK